jgi:hypothetical protein
MADVVAAVAPAAPAPSQEQAFQDAAKARQPYYAKRIELFEQYNVREKARVEEARKAAV